MSELSFDEAFKGAYRGGAAPHSRAVLVDVGVPVLSGGVVRITAVLRNNRSAPATICMEMPPVVVSPPQDPRVRFAGAPRPPPAPPAPAILEVPAESAVRLEGSLDLGDWTWDGAIDVELGWAIAFFEGPTVRGRFTLRLAR